VRVLSLPGRSDLYEPEQRRRGPRSSASGCRPACGASGAAADRLARIGAHQRFRGPSAAPSRDGLHRQDHLHRQHRREAAISTDKAQSWVYSEEFLPEDDVLLRARERAAQLGCSPVLPGSGAVLSVLAAAAGARAVVEIGTGTGVGSLYLLRGMPTDGVLTTIDLEVEHQRAAKEAFTEEGVRPTRTRTISGRALDVLPRLTDGGYDLVFVDADKESYPGYVEQAVRLLRPGGVLAVDNALWHDRVADPARRDELTTIIREVGRTVRGDDRLLPALLPSGDGLLVAVRR
jgi:predicted O-methyltransferase YrrM